MKTHLVYLDKTIRKTIEVRAKDRKALKRKVNWEIATNPELWGFKPVRFEELRGRR